MRKHKPLGIRFEGAMVKRIDALAEKMSAQACGAHITRSEALRVALERGLCLLEAEFSITPSQVYQSTVSADRRRAFNDELRKKLERDGLELTGTTLGRGRLNEPFWDVSVRTSDGQHMTKRVYGKYIKASPYGPWAIPAIRAAFSGVKQ